MKKRLKASIIIVLFAIGFLPSCMNNWEEHYENIPATVDMNIWDAMKEDSVISRFVEAMEELGYNNLFNSDNTYTLFIPKNNELEAYLDTTEISERLLNYHISRHYVQSEMEKNSIKIQTLGEKFVPLLKYNNVITFDGIVITDQSPLYRNGRYFKMDQVAQPKPNLYEYISENNSILKAFIDSKDSIVLDREKSIPIGFDEFGNTTYDTVAVVINEFEEEFFEIREEFRSKTATLVFPKEEYYDAALDAMAASLGDLYKDHTDIPLSWQYDILIPYLLEQGVFINSLDEHEFVPSGLKGDTLKLKNVLGDSIAIDYTPTEKRYCSNGIAYDIEDFVVPDTLFGGVTRFEGEWLLDRSGTKYKFIEEVDIQGVKVFPPQIVQGVNFSNDSVFFVGITLGNQSSYSVEFNIDNLFPRKYLMVIRTSMSTGGLFKIYFDGLEVKEFNSYDLILNPHYYKSIVPNKYYFPKNGYINYDCFITNENEYGNAKVKLEYIGPANMPSNGLVFDYIDFIPYDDE